MPETITPEMVRELAHRVYRRRLDCDRDRASFDALPEKRQHSRSIAYEPVVRAVMLELGWVEPERPPIPSRWAKKTETTDG